MRDTRAPFIGSTRPSIRPLRIIRSSLLREATVLVVGGAGYVGSIACRNLLEAGYNVIVLDPQLYGSQSLAALLGQPGFELHIADTRDEHVLVDLLARAGTVLHLGEIVGDPACDLDPQVTVSVNHTATVRLAQLAVRAGVERFIYPSSCSVYGATEKIVDEHGPFTPISLYGRLKLMSEREILALRSDRFHPTIFRLATVYGLSPRPRFDLVVNTLAGRAATDRRISVQGGGQWRPFVHVADVAEVLTRTVQLPLDEISGEIFNLGSDSQNHTIADVAELVQARVPDVVVDVTEGTDRRNYRVSFAKLASTLGFTPSRTVTDGINEIVRAVENRHVVDVRDAQYSNVRALVETSARTRLWRTDLRDSQPASPFRPRDVEDLRVAGTVAEQVLEDAVS